MEYSAGKRVSRNLRNPAKDAHGVSERSEFTPGMLNKHAIHCLWYLLLDDLKLSS